MKLGGRVFSKLGRTLPQEVCEFLNLGSLDLNGETYSCNFHSQFQKPLLLEYSQQKVMEILSASSALDDLKETKECVLSERAKNKGAIAAIESILNKSNEALQYFSDRIEEVAPVVEQFQTVYENYEVRNDIISKLDSLSELVDVSEKLSEEISILDKVDGESSRLNEIENKLSLLETLSESIDSESILEVKLRLNSKIEELFDEGLDENVKKCVMLQSLIETLERQEKTESNITIKSETLDKIISCNDNIQNHVNRQYDVRELESLMSTWSMLSVREDDLLKIVDGHMCPICGNHVNNI